MIKNVKNTQTQTQTQTDTDTDTDTDTHTHTHTHTHTYTHTNSNKGLTGSSWKHSWKCAINMLQISKTQTQSLVQKQNSVKVFG